VTVRHEAAIDIDAGVEAPFDYLTSANRWPEWAYGILECRVDGGEPMARGSTLRQKAKMVRRVVDRTVIVAEYEPNRRLTFAGEMGPSPLRFGYRLEPKGSGSMVTGWVEVEPRSFMRLLAPIIRPVLLRPVFNAELKKIKAASEPAGAVR
jgi:hypothetical protein